MTSITALKIVAATLVFVGAIWGFIDINYAPDQILAEGSPEPLVVADVGWLGYELDRRDPLHRARLPEVAKKRRCVVARDQRRAEVLGRAG